MYGNLRCVNASKTYKPFSFFAARSAEAGDGDDAGRLHA